MLNSKFLVLALICIYQAECQEPPPDQMPPPPGAPSPIPAPIIAPPQPCLPQTQPCTLACPQTFHCERYLTGSGACGQRCVKNPWVCPRNANMIQDNWCDLLECRCTDGPCSCRCPKGFECCPYRSLPAVFAATGSYCHSVCVKRSLYGY